MIRGTSVLNVALVVTKIFYFRHCTSGRLWQNILRTYFNVAVYIVYICLSVYLMF